MGFLKELVLLTADIIQDVLGEKHAIKTDIEVLRASNDKTAYDIMKKRVMIFGDRWFFKV